MCNSEAVLSNFPSLWTVFCRLSGCMATSFTTPGAGSGPGPGGAAAGDEQSENAGLPLARPSAAEEQALIASGLPAVGDGLQVSPVMERLPVELDVCVPVRDFRVRHLLALEAGHVIESLWQHGDDVPLTAGEVQLAWSEFEVIEEQLAVRVTRLP